MGIIPFIQSHVNDPTFKVECDLAKDGFGKIVSEMHIPSKSMKFKQEDDVVGWLDGNPVTKKQMREWLTKNIGIRYASQYNPNQ